MNNLKIGISLGILPVLFFFACKTDIPPTTSAVIDKPSYYLEIFGADGAGSEDGRKIIRGDNVGSTWSSDQGTVWLGTDKFNLPIATITMGVADINTDNKEGIFKDFYLSTTDVNFGTAEELNAKLYYAEKILVTDLEIGPNYIKGRISNAELTEINTLETVHLLGLFTALDNYNP